MTSILLIDDHPVFIRGMKALLQKQGRFDIAGEAHSAADAMKELETKNPDIAIVDLNLGQDDGLELVKKIRKYHSRTIVLVVSMLNERIYAERSLAAGARGFVMKDQAGGVLVEAIDAVLAGKIWLSEKEKDNCLENYFQAGKTPASAQENSIKNLSDRQLQIFVLMGQGHGSATIAEKLFISRKTVEAHKSQIKEKLGCGTAQDLLKLAIEWTSGH